VLGRCGGWPPGGVVGGCRGGAVGGRDVGAEGGRRVGAARAWRGCMVCALIKSFPSSGTLSVSVVRPFFLCHSVWRVLLFARQTESHRDAGWERRKGR
jgi:hypothetical protein